MMVKLLFLFYTLSSLCFAESFEDYQKNMAEEYSAYYQKELKAFQGFIQTSDGIPNKINPYQNMSILPPHPSSDTEITPKSPLSPEPVARPKVLDKPKNLMPEGTPSGSQIKTLKLQEIDVKKLIAPDPILPQPPSVLSAQNLQLSFFGTSLPIEQKTVAFLKNLRFSGDVSAAAEEIHRYDPPLIQSLRLLCREYRLNDWDRVLLVQTLMNTLYSAHQHQLKTIHAVDLLRGLGYQTLLGEDDAKHLYFLVTSKQPMYSKSYYLRDGIRYYLFAIDAHPRADVKTSLHFYRTPEDTKGSALDMVMHQDPKIGLDQTAVILHWDFENVPYSMNVSVNKYLTSLMDMYPQIDYSIYMQSRSGGELIRDMARQLKKEITTRHFSEEQSVAYILRFVQQAFLYKTDFEAYGYERPLFAEQTILLPYSDCEDRAILLSQLYRETLGIDTVGLQYPGHVSLGAEYAGKGDFYTLNRHNYYVTDGTYFYALPGMSQPSFKNAPAKILPTR